MSSFQLNIKDLSNELEKAKDILEKKLEDLKLEGISQENINYIKLTFEESLKKENLEYLKNKQTNSINSVFDKNILRH